MYVPAGARGKGVGKTLITEILSFASDRQSIEQIMYLSVVTINHSAKRFIPLCWI
ncbi:GNAT family N-acetyltransferase [Bacillus altitudinis]|uniref:GNAT family N-acetyltransferase n=1 Tax=Bacillus pumilus TaxID=1408 RepID=UPI0025A2F9E7|nr:GNAT family N-acetyltransferase [Bacillus pumilus]MDM5320748.1 GNAT family N-acetyltransferase [Bacillus pumilus]MDR4995888.1 GNAT family N-acetyltransferase [Bacillus altitudinis]